MAWIAMYPSYAALEASVGKPFRFINTKNPSRGTLAHVYAYSPGPTLAFPDWIAYVSMDTWGNITAVERLA